MNVLAGDIGGTSTRLAICNDRAQILVQRRYESKGFETFDAVVQTFLAEVNEKPDRACFAIAGPVINERIKITNLSWVIDVKALEASLGISNIQWVNDFYANALAVLEMNQQDLVSITDGSCRPGGPIAVLGAGTGLGEAFLIFVHNRYEVITSEGGHTDFAPTNDRQIELLRYLREKLQGRVSYERLLSGPGLLNIYKFLRDRGYGRENPNVLAEMKTQDPASVISRYGLNGQDALCDTTLSIFCEIYGQEAGNLALKVLATGGVFICGGIAPRMIERLQDGTFKRAYLDKGRMSSIVQEIPVQVITHPNPGLIGSAVAALRL